MAALELAEMAVEAMAAPLIILLEQTAWQTLAVVVVVRLALKQSLELEEMAAPALSSFAMPSPSH